MVSLPDNALRHALPREARVLRRHRLLPERHRPPRRRRPARQPAGRGRGHGHAGRGPGHQDQQGRRLPGRGAAGLADHPGHRAARSAGRTASRSPSPREIFEELRVASQGRRRRLLRHHLREDRAADWASSGRAQRGSARPASRSTIPARRGCSSAAAATRSPRAAGRSTSPTARPASTSPTIARRSTTSSDEYPIYPHHRPRRQPVPLRHADPAHRPARRPVPRAADRDAPAAGGEARHRRRRLDDGRDAPRRPSRCGAGRHDDPPRHGLHPVPLGRAGRARTS